MSSPESTSQTTGLNVLEASVFDVRPIAAILRGLEFGRRATVAISGAGLKITVEDRRTLLATGYINFDLFDEYTYNHPASEEDETERVQDDELLKTVIEISIESMVDCLNVFGSAGPVNNATGSGGSRGKKRWKKGGRGSDDERDEGRERRGIEFYFQGHTDRRVTNMRMVFRGEGWPLSLYLTEEADGPLTECHLTTYTPDPLMELPFDDEQKVVRVIMKSTWLRDALSELDPTCDKITFICYPASSDDQKQPGKPMLRLRAAGMYGTVEMDYPRDDAVLETYECEDMTSFSYSYKHIHRALKALQGSVRTSMRMDDEGLMSLQMAMPMSRTKQGERQSFLEFRCRAVEDP